jgi:CDP-paratose 2-epimerase
MTYLVTGGCGFVGANIARQLLADGQDVVAFDNLSRHGSEDNLVWLRSLGLKHFVKGDVSHREAVEKVVADHKPQAILHLAGQVAMTRSMENPRLDFETNVVGSLNVLEAARQHAPKAAILYSSSNKVYGDLRPVKLVEAETRYTAPDFPNGVDEDAPLDFHTPYGCSKGAADQYMIDYARNFGMNTVVFRHSTIYGGRQYATFDQGWVGWFCQQALQQVKDPNSEPFTIAGDGKQVRDLLFVDDAVACYLTAIKRVSSARGQAFNIGGGIANSSSLLELFAELESMLSIKLRYRRTDWRADDQRFFVADPAKAKKLIGWEPKVAKKDGIRAVCGWVETMKR